MLQESDPLPTEVDRVAIARHVRIIITRDERPHGDEVPESRVS